MPRFKYKSSVAYPCQSTQFKNQDTSYQHLQCFKSHSTSTDTQIIQILPETTKDNKNHSSCQCLHHIDVLCFETLFVLGNG
ncbi:hypothetical protein OIU79_028409 [Salix purpurea]|uniref:Uncharacterized protein n=1 Tax=Salix purpurea TaxID=77065 RepID=A0A9Q0VVZ3_SALPP|nr:hypothetical protein OIU79_028409 [Salix purpurea]